MHPIQPVILSGGAGSRLWPLSREAFPKQFLPLGSEHSMLQATWKRVKAISERGAIVVANVEHRFIVAEQLREVQGKPDAIVLEPMGRNTAPAIALAAIEATRNGQDALLLVLPSDHVVSNESSFHAAVDAAAEFARQGRLVTFGVVPTRAETGYGYIKRGKTTTDQASLVECFVEKPDESTAERYVESGEYLWNSGMFVFLASRYLQELDRLNPAILASCRKALALAHRDDDFVRVDVAEFSACPSDSIDYAVMEKSECAMVVPLDAGWSDLGSWCALWEIAEKDAEGNAFEADTLSIACSNNYVLSNRLVAMVGLDNIVVVDTDDALLVGHRESVQKVKDIVGELKRCGRTHATTHRKVYRPWGSYDSVDAGQRFQVKRITVKPGAALSLQMHHHRAEHWIVVSGTARVTRGDEVLLLAENQSTYIPLGVVHRLENPGKVPLELIEVQSGSYLGEDDIVRFEDVYGRIAGSPLHESTP